MQELQNKQWTEKPCRHISNFIKLKHCQWLQPVCQTLFVNLWEAAAQLGTKTLYNYPVLSTKIKHKQGGWSVIKYCLKIIS